MTNKELFDQKMNTIADNITSKAFVSGKQTIEQLTEIVEGIGDSFSTIYTDENGIIVDPVNYEPYIGQVDTQPSEEEVQVALDKICQDYGFTKVELFGESISYGLLSEIPRMAAYKDEQLSITSSCYRYFPGSTYLVSMAGWIDIQLYFMPEQGGEII